MMNWTRCLLLITSVFVFTEYWSQSWIFELKPGMKFSAVNYFKTEGKINNSANNSYFVTNLNHTKTLLLEPELFLDFYKINRKWQVGIGITTFNWESWVKIRATGTSFDLDPTSTVVYTDHIQKATKLRYLQFSGTLTRIFRTTAFFDKYFLNKLIFGFGINNPSRFNPKNDIKMYYYSVLDNNNGYIASLDYKKDSFWRHCSPFIQLKYELVIMNKRNNFGRFNIDISYVQGFQNQFSYSLYNSNLDGASMTAKTQFRLSGFRFGISKIFASSKKEKEKRIFD